MGYVTYDSSGNIVSQSASPTTPTGGGSGGTTSGSTFVLNMGHYWNSNAPANTMAQTQLAVVNVANNGNGLTPYSWTASGAGSVLGISMYDAGPAGGSHSVQIGVNGVSAQTVVMGSGANNFNAQQPANVTFAQNDQVTAWVTCSNAGNTQSQVAFTIKLN